MPYENGKINWWAIVAILVPVITFAVGFLMNNWINSKDKYFETMIVQNQRAINQHVADMKEVMRELQAIDRKQDEQLNELKSSFSTLCWAISIPYAERMKRFNNMLNDPPNHKKK